MKKLFLVITLFLILTVAFSTMPCKTSMSNVSEGLIENLLESDYINKIKSNYSVNIRPTFGCGNIPDDYLNIQIGYKSKNDFLYDLQFDTKCYLTSLTCDFDLKNFEERVAYLESKPFIYEGISNQTYAFAEVEFEYNRAERFRYTPTANPKTPEERKVLDIYLSNGMIESAFIQEENSNKCMDFSIICESNPLQLAIMGFIATVIIVAIVIIVYKLHKHKRK